MEFWGEEVQELPRGKSLKYKVLKILESTKTPFQQLDIVETQFFGKMLLLDGVIMLTEYDEFAYHEMITHVPMLSHPNPESVLVIGGGDGGCIREIIKHPSVKKVVLCEIDECVVNSSRRHFPTIACGLSDPRVTIEYKDGAVFTKEHPNTFDVIIVDSTDPIGPGEILFQEPFYRDMKKALRAGGIAVTQSESFFDEPAIMKSLYEFIPRVFEHYGYYWTTVPTYPSGTIGFSFVSDSVDPYAANPDPKRVPNGLRYYTPAMHKASFAVPAFALKIT